MQEKTPVSATEQPAEGTTGYTWANDGDAVPAAPASSSEAHAHASATLSEQSGYTFASEEGEESLEHSGFTARGTLLFVMIMLLGYAIYWAYLWFIVMIERGTGVL